MARLCELPSCARPALVAYGFDAPRRVVWFEQFDVSRDALAAGRLCRRHAESLIPPKGWWVDDRRVGGGDNLFEPPPPVAPTSRTARRVRTEMADTKAAARELPFESELPEELLPRENPSAPEPAVVVTESDIEPTDEVVEPAWTPQFDVADDVRGLLNARTPLLARAFTAGAKRKPQ